MSFLDKTGEFLWGIGILAFFFCPMVIVWKTTLRLETGKAIALGFGLPAAVMFSGFLLQWFARWWDDGRAQTTRGR